MFPKTFWHLEIWPMCECSMWSKFWIWSSNSKMFYEIAEEEESMMSHLRNLGNYTLTIAFVCCWTWQLTLDGRYSLSEGTSGGSTSYPQNFEIGWQDILQRKPRYLSDSILLNSINYQFWFYYLMCKIRSQYFWVISDINSKYHKY